MGMPGQRRKLSAEQRALLSKANAGIFGFFSKQKPPSDPADVPETVEKDRIGSLVSPQKVSVVNAADALDEILRRLDEQKKVPLTVPGSQFVRAVSGLKARSFLQNASSEAQRSLKMLLFHGKRLQEALATHERAEAEVRRQVAAVRSQLGGLS